MQSFEFVRLETDGACLIKGFASGDNRGSFTKTFEKNTFLSNGIKFTADEIFTSVSCKNVIRGLHFSSAARRQNLSQSFAEEHRT